MQSTILVSLVLYNSVSTHSAVALQKCIASLARQEFFLFGKNLQLVIVDNASSDNSLLLAKETVAELNLTAHFIENSTNLGFCGAHNQAAGVFLELESDYFLTINPDLTLAENALAELRALQITTGAGLLTPQIRQANQSLDPLEPATIDAAGMIITRDIRHFDRGQGSLASLYQESTQIFGATGACLFITRDCLRDLLLPRLEEDFILEKIYPGLGGSNRPQLFDESFLAYREDADLAWRAALFGWSCWYAAKALAWHRRLVTAAQRKKYSAEINALGVKNRFLLQHNNLNWQTLKLCFWRGFLLRNLLVILACLLVEQRSLKGLWEYFLLLPRCRKMRRYIQSKHRALGSKVSAKFIEGYFNS